MLRHIATGEAHHNLPEVWNNMASPRTLWHDFLIDLKSRNGNIDGLVQGCSNSSALAMELLQSCTKPSICVSKTSQGTKDRNVCLGFGKQRHDMCISVLWWVQSISSIEHVTLVAIIGTTNLVPNLCVKSQQLILTHLPLVPYICISESGQHWFR